MTFERSLRPPPGIDLIDAICISADQRERQQASQPANFEAMMTVMMKMMEMQGQTLQALAALIMRNDDKTKAKP